jgi:signal recognition particle GTPase
MTTKGYSAETAIAVLSTLASRGVPPNADLGYLRARVFEEMRRRNRTVIANTRTGRHVFVGTCGSGKTNLILKIANDTSTRASGRTIVLTLGEPSSSTAAATTAYAQAGVESLHIHSAQQLSYSHEVLARYETVLIDVPSLSCSPETCDLQVRQIAATLEPLDLLTIHYVIDVRRNLDDVSEDIGSCGLAVDALALTNLDGLKRPGLLIDFLARHERPVFFASSSRYQSGSGLDRFVPADLIANSLGLDEWPYSENELNDYFQTASTRTSNRSMDFGDSIALRPMGVNGRI